MSSPRIKNTAARFDSLEQEAYLNLWRTYDRLRAIEEGVFGPRGITSQQYNVLRLLAAQHPVAVPTLTIAERMISKAPDITRMLDKLESLSLIERARPAENRRRVLISLTTKGLELLVEIAEPLQECHKSQLGHLSSEELERLISLLSQARKPHERSGNPWS
jgi:DNA-binding MarR family transcriptional regulator